ncbi:hypothetical protein HDU86_007506 [Geranomyces michiganensis]|nr:hypothetical protein HDU86_007506 [Geranomyces michiganensis]
MIFKPDETIDIPEVDITTLTFSAKFPDDTVYLIRDADGATITHGDMRREYPKFTAGLQAFFNWQPGQVVAVVAWNSIAYPTVCWGTLAAGGVVMGLNPGFTAEELVMRMEACRPHAILAAADLLDTVLEVAKRINFPTNRIVLMPDIQGKADADAASVLKTSVWGWHSALIIDNVMPKLFELKGAAVRKHPAFVIFSSGTTGIPKAAQLSHYNYCAMISRMAADRANLIFSDSAPYLILPFWAQPGISHCLIAGFFLGYPTVVTPSYDFLQLLALIEKYRPRQLQTTPQIVNLLARDPCVSDHDLSSLTHVLVAGAPTSRDAITLCQDRLGVQVLNNYGLTEMTLLVTRNLPGDNRVGSVGRLYLNTEAKIVDEDGCALGHNEQGELLIRAPGVLNAYIGRTPEESGIDADGFMKTGDMALIDDASYVFITERKNEIFKCQDRLVAPALIENVLFTHPSVNDCCVIPVWVDSKSTYLPRAYLVLNKQQMCGRSTVNTFDDRAQRHALVGEVMAYVAGRVKPHMALLGGVVLADALPRHENGKVLRKVVKEMDALGDAEVIGMAS